MPVVSPSTLHRLTIDVLGAKGAPEEHASCVADSLVRANLTGHDSHGVMKLPSYVRDIDAGKLDPTASPVATRRAATSVSVDGAHAFGHVCARLAADSAVDLAAETGVGMVSVSRAHHTGRLGNWSERMARSGFIGLLFGGEGQPPYKVAPFGGRHGAMATNPFSCAFPRGGGRAPILLDYTTSVVSIGKLQAARAAGRPIDDDWILDADGEPTSNVDDFFEGGVLTPFGAYKGYALAVLAELLAVGLSDGRARAPGERSSCLLVMAIDPGTFRDAESLDEFADGLVERLHGTAPRVAGEHVLVPGEPESASAEQRRAGIPVPADVWRALVDLASTLGVDVAAD